MGHFGQVDHLGPTGDVPPERNLERMGGLFRLVGGEHIAQGHQLTAPVGHLHPDGRLARDGRQDSDVRRGHGVGDVLGQRGHPGHLDPGTELQFVSGDRRSHGPPYQAGVDAVGGQGGDQGHPTGVHLLLVDGVGFGVLEQRVRRESPIPDRRAQFHRQRCRAVGIGTGGRPGSRIGCQPVVRSRIGRGLGLRVVGLCGLDRLLRVGRVRPGRRSHRPSEGVGGVVLDFRGTFTLSIPAPAGHRGTPPCRPHRARRRPHSPIPRSPPPWPPPAGPPVRWWPQHRQGPARADCR